MTISILLLKNKASFKWKLKQWQDIPCLIILNPHGEVEGIGLSDPCGPLPARDTMWFCDLTDLRFLK